MILACPRVRHPAVLSCCLISAPPLHPHPSHTLCRFGFVSYDNDDDAAEAIRKLDGTDWNGRRLLVSASASAGLQ